MSETSIDIQEIITASVEAAVAAGLTGLDEKIEAAINLAIPIGMKVGIEVGAKVGAEVGAEAAAKAIERERKNYRKRQYDWKFQNTKLLLRNYRRLNAYYGNAVFDNVGAEEADEDFEEIMRDLGRPVDEKLFVESIQKNYLRTKIIMTHVNKMLECYQIMCERSKRREDARRWRVLDGLYISDDYTTAEEIAKQEQIDKRTVYRDIDICAEDLTMLFFGVGGIDGF